MASAITLKGIDQAVSQLGYSNESTLKYRFIRYIRNYYLDNHSLISLNRIDHAALIKRLWETHDDPEIIKNKRKNLNSLRSSVNADFNKLYKKGLNPEGVKIGSDNIFVMSEDAKDNILKSFGYDLQPNGMLKIDQIVDILKLANETLSGALGAEDTTTEDSIRKKDRLKDLIKGLSDKLGLGDPEFSKGGTGTESQQSDSPILSDDIRMDGKFEAVDEEKISSKIADIEDVEVLEEVADVTEDKILDDIEDPDEEDILEDADEDIPDDVEDIITDVIEDSDPEMNVEEEVLDEDIEDALDEDDELEYVDVEKDDHIGGDVAGEPGDEPGTGIEGFSEGIRQEQGLGQGEGEKGSDATGTMRSDLNAGFEAGDQRDDEEIAFAMGEGGKHGAGFGEMNEDLNGIAPDAVDEIMELDELDEIKDADEEDILEDADEDIPQDVEDIITDVIEDSDPEMDVEEEVLDEDIEDGAEEDDEVEYVDVEENGHVGSDVAGRPGDESGTGGDGEEKEIEQLGLPADSFGKDYGAGKDTKLKKERLLAEAFDGYLGSMDRYYNHYILISGGEYLIGSRNPKKDGKPEQIVRLNPFYFGRFPVTNGLFEIFVEKTGYITTAEKVGYGTVYYGRFEKKTDDKTGRIISKWNSSLYCKMIKGACWYRPTGPEGTLHNKRNHPVVQVSLEDAAAFAAWTGKRLPTENEWEAASRTANGWIFPWGHEWKNDACNIEESGFADTSPVDKYADFENDFGIYDVLGNVLEWTSDGFKLTSQGNYETTYQIAKGGSWVSGNDIRLYCRFLLEPDTHSNILGFRCVAD